MVWQEQLADVLLPFTQRAGHSVESGLRDLPLKWNPSHLTIPVLNFYYFFLHIFFTIMCHWRVGTLVESGLKKWAGGGGLPPPIPLRTERMHCTAPLAAAARDGCPYPLAVWSVGQLSLVFSKFVRGQKRPRRVHYCTGADYSLKLIGCLGT